MTTQPPRIHAMIVAAGRGSRFGADVPKQYLKFNDQTLLQHSVARLATSRYIHDCVLVLAKDDTMGRALDFGLPIHYAHGGAERWQSVQAGLQAIIESGANAQDLVLIHDAARPAVPTADIDSVIAAAIEEPYGAILAAPVADTLKQAQTTTSGVCGAHDYAWRTIDRTGMWQAQTPQVFRIGSLRQVLDHVATHHLNITDEASAFELLSYPIRLVSGSRQNIKLTYPDDAIVLNAIIAAQQSPT